MKLFLYVFNVLTRIFCFYYKYMASAAMAIGPDYKLHYVQLTKYNLTNLDNIQYHRLYFNFL